MRKLSAIAFALVFATSAWAQSITGGGGGGGGGGSGTVTSIATDCGISGGPITTTGTISGIVTPNPQTGANYTIVTGDCGKLVNLSNGANQVPTIAEAGSVGFASGWYVNVCNQGAGTQTITPATSTIGGAATYVLAAGSAAAPVCVSIVSDGTNYQVAPSGQATTDASLLTSGTLAAARLPAFTDDCTSSAGSASLTCNQPPPMYIASNWFVAGGEMLNTGASNSTVNNGTVSCYPFFFRKAATITALGGFVNTTSAGGNYSVAIYANNATTGRPTGTNLANSGNLSTTASAAVSGVVSLAIASPRWLWACANSDNGTATLRAGTFLAMSAFIGSATQANIDAGSSKLSGVTTPVTFASGWTDLTGATWTEANARNWPLVQFKL